MNEFDRSLAVFCPTLPQVPSGGYVTRQLPAPRKDGIEAGMRAIKGKTFFSEFSRARVRL